jgi:hypothetical protein
MAIIVALLSMLLMSALGAALVLTASSETTIAANFRDGQQGLYAADAALERALDDLASIADWDGALRGEARSGFVDGPPSGVRMVAGGTQLDLAAVANMANCRRPDTCSAASLVALTAARPWGPNNPVWRLFAYGPLVALLPSPAVESPFYGVVMVADDPAENDGDPLDDGESTDNPGARTLWVRAESFGPRAAHYTIKATVARSGTIPPAIRVLAWRSTR